MGETYEEIRDEIETLPSGTTLSIFITNVKQLEAGQNYMLKSGRLTVMADILLLGMASVLFPFNQGTTE